MSKIRLFSSLMLLAIFLAACAPTSGSVPSSLTAAVPSSTSISVPSSATPAELSPVDALTSTPANRDLARTRASRHRSDNRQPGFRRTAACGIFPLYLSDLPLDGAHGPWAGSKILWQDPVSPTWMQMIHKPGISNAPWAFTISRSFTCWMPREKCSKSGLALQARKS